MQENRKSKSNKLRTEQSRAALIKAARTFFATKGYAETSTPEIVQQAGVTRGALYHHYKDKLDLFRAVVTQEYTSVAAEIDAYALESPSSAIDALKQGSRAFLRAMQDQGRVRLMLVDGPLVLGFDELGEIDRRTSMDSLRLGLEAAMDAGEMRRLPLDALTLQLSALFDRAALAISEGADREAHLEVLDAVFDSLKAE